MSGNRLPPLKATAKSVFSALLTTEFLQQKTKYVKMLGD